MHADLLELLPSRDLSKAASRALGRCIGYVKVGPLPVQLPAVPSIAINHVACQLRCSASVIS